MADRPRFPIKAMALSATALVGLALHEGFRDKAYDDGVGVQTIGFGRTAGVKPGDRTTVERELVFLNKDVDERQTQMRACVGDVPLAQNEWDAYVSFAYNVGVRAFCGSSAVRYLKQNPPDYAKACGNLLEWNRAGGRVLPGLVTRRDKEYKLCMGDAP